MSWSSAPYSSVQSLLLDSALDFIDKWWFVNFRKGLDVTA